MKSFINNKGKEILKFISLKVERIKNSTLLRCMKNTNVKLKIKRWLTYGVFYSVAPYFLLILFNLIVGYELSIINTLPDYLLLTFAVAGNTLGNESDYKKKIPSKYINICIFVSKATLILSILFYVGLFNDGFIAAKVYDSMEANISRLYIFRFFVSVALFLNIIIGIILEICIEYEKEVRKEKRAQKSRNKTK